MSEVSQCTTESKDGDFRVPLLCARPLLQSTYAEVLRLRVVFASKFKPMPLQYTNQTRVTGLTRQLLQYRV